MKRLICLFALISAAAFGQTQMPRVSEVSYLYWADQSCYMRDDDKLLVVLPGKASECWQATVQAHNENMSNSRSHAMVDDILSRVAKALGRTYVACSPSAHSRWTK
jgi:hypothetical protein